MWIISSDDYASEGTPLTPMDSLRSPTKYALPSVTKVIKGHDGKTYVQSVVDVEDDVLSEENEDYIISDDEIDKEMRNISQSNLNMTRSSISTNISMRGSRKASITK